MEKQPNYLAWVAVIAIGVATGNLLSGGIVAIGAGIQIRSAMAEFQEELEQNTARTNAQLEEGKQRRQREARARRAESERGKALRHQCLQWRENFGKLDTPTIRQKIDESCRAYADYVDGK